jgi:hypothetical protein
LIKNTDKEDYFYCCAGWGYIGVSAIVLTMYGIQHTRIYTLPCWLSSSPSLIPATVSTGIIFALTYMWIHYLGHPSLDPPHLRGKHVLPSCSPIL